MDVIFKLCGNKFSKLTYQEQLEIKEQGRRTSQLSIEVAGKSIKDNLIRMCVIFKP